MRGRPLITPGVKHSIMKMCTHRFKSMLVVFFLNCNNKGGVLCMNYATTWQHSKDHVDIARTVNGKTSANYFNKHNL